MSGEESGSGQRIDRWLWFARIFKSRSLASRAVAEDGVRVTRAGATQRVEKPAFALRVQDVVTLKRKDEVRVLEVVALGARRGPASEALGLYNDLSPAPAATTKFTASPRPPTRPSKRDRREIGRLKGWPQGE
jgi:ribosome-associated heat shock protein Hsp15